MSEQTFELLHPGIQKAIWKMGWKEFKPIQVRSVHAICETENHIVICAPTAGGKTEAAFLPIISRLAADPQQSVQAIYVGPLKALINDQFRRLEDLCTELEIPVHRWHGDIPANQKKALRESPAGILLITPESLESNFINFGAQISRVYRFLSFIVIDELHSFLGNVRGIHLQSLLSRLSIANRCSPRLVGLSATLADVRSARAFIAPDDLDSVEVITDGSAKREIKFGLKVFLKKPHQANADRRLKPEEALAMVETMCASVVNCEPVHDSILAALRPEAEGRQEPTEDELDEIAKDIIKNFQLSTNLIFANSKQSIEVLADRLHQQVRREKWVSDPFLVHHGSLSKDLREDAEAALKSGVPTTALCSSTLEMGIDIGNVNAIGQLDTPWTVSSMVQRLGRSGRRPGEPSIMRMYVREESPNGTSSLTDLLYPDLLRAVAMIRLMLAKWLEPSEAQHLNLSTLTHQILSCLKQTGGMHATALYQTLCERGPFRSVARTHFSVLLRSLASHRLIEQVPQGDLVLGLEGERLTAGFDFYAAFKTVEEFLIRCGPEEIGKLSASLLPPVGEHLILAGKRWRVEEILFPQKVAFVIVSPGGKAPAFDGAAGEIHSGVMCEIKNVLFDSAEPAYLDQNGKLLLRSARKLAQMVGLPTGDLICGKQTIQWFPWVGSRTLRTLSLMAKSSAIPHDLDRLSITFHVRSREELLNQLRQLVRFPPDAISLARLLPIKSVEKFDDFISDDLLDEENSRKRIDLAGAFRACEALATKAAIASPPTVQPHPQ